MSSLLGPVTDADLRRWQRARYKLLGELLDLADEHGLPVLSWKVGGHVLVGEAHQFSSADKRHAYQAWVTALGLDEWPAHPSETGRTHLHALTRDWRGRGVDVAVTADVWDAAEEGEQ